MREVPVKEAAKHIVELAVNLQREICSATANSVDRISRRFADGCEV